MRLGFVATLGLLFLALLAWAAAPFESSSAAPSGGSNNYLPLLAHPPTPLPPTVTPTPAPSSPNPLLSNGRHEVIEVNSQQYCGGFGQPYRSAIIVDVDYGDPNGDGGPQGIIYDDGQEIPPEYINFAGDGFVGTFSIGYCIRFGSAKYINIVYQMRDAAGNLSNPLPVFIPRPPGGNLNDEGAPEVQPVPALELPR